jgi:hypothetical protein
MKKVMTAVFALSAVAFGATVVTAQAEDQTPSPPTASHPIKKRTVSRTPRLSQAASGASTCTGLRSYCLSYLKGEAVLGNPANASATAAYFCNFDREQCMKTGWWAGFGTWGYGGGLSRPAERR